MRLPQQFLKVVLGSSGSAALIKAAKQAEELAGAIYPRTITAWLEALEPFGFEGVVPGTTNNFSLAKSEAGLSGSITLDGALHQFKDASLYYVAGCVAVALGLEPHPSTLAKSEKLIKLGKSIDLLIKGAVVKAELDAKINQRAKKIQLPGSNLGKAQIKPNKRTDLAGPAAAPLAPLPPTPEVGIQNKNQTQDKPGAVGTNSIVKLPGQNLKPKRPQLSVTKSEAASSCPTCGQRQFLGSNFVGCLCFKSLAKGVSVVTNRLGNFDLRFDKDWDQDAIESLLQVFKNG